MSPGHPLPAARTMPIRHRLFRFCSALLLAFALGGCTSTTVVQYHAGDSRPVCQEDGTASPVLILWGAAWRKDQHHRAEREAAAERGIRQYFARRDCFPHAYIAGQAMGRSPLTLSDIDMIRWARGQATPFNMLIQVRVEELDVRTQVQPSLVLWESDSLVQLRVRVLDMASMRLHMDRTVHWKNGGGYAVRNTSTLSDDLSSALGAVFTQQFSRY